MNWPIVLLEVILLYLLPVTSGYREHKLELISLGHSEDLFYNVSSNALLECRYINKSVCDSVKTTNITILTPEDTIRDSLIVINSSKCHLMVEFQNLTKDFSGIYLCKDTINNFSRQRTMAVGNPPLPPTTVTVLYQPLEFISLLLNVIETGLQLGELEDSLNVTYTWRSNNYLPCPGKKPEHKTKYSYNNSYVACVLDLHGKYSQGQSYARDLGSVLHNISFKIIIRNEFGRIEKNYSFRISNYVRPGQVQNVNMTTKGSTWIQLKVNLPEGIERDLCYKHMTMTGLKLKYVVTKVSEFEHSMKLPHNRDFHTKFGLWRNLHNDEEEALSQNLAKQEWKKEFDWKKDYNCQTAMVNLTDLLPYTIVNITLQSKGRYSGPKQHLYGIFTDETVPLKGPQFPVSPYHCYMNGICMTCAVYFLEIPRPLRRGQIIEYILNGSLDSSTIHPDTMRCRKKFSERVRGQDNTFIIHELEPQSVYNLSLQARAKAGFSPITYHSLQTPISLVPGSPTYVIVEKNSNTYTIIWRAHDAENFEAQKDINYCVHYCYVQTFDEQDEAIYGLDCKTNLVSFETKGNLRKNVSISDGCIKDLELLFFVSLVTPGGKSGSLSKAECLYSTDRWPGKVESFSVQKSDEDPRHLTVTFRVPCGQSYKFSRPDLYQIMIRPGGDCLPCNRNQSSEDIFLEVNPDRIGWEIKETFTNLQPTKEYCVQIKSLYKDLFQCVNQVVSTGDVMYPRVIIIIIAVIIPFIVTLALFVRILWKCKTASSKFDTVKIKYLLPQQKQKSSKAGLNRIVNNHLASSPNIYTNPLHLNSNSTDLIDHFSGNHDNKLLIEMDEAGTDGFLMNKSNKLAPLDQQPQSPEVEIDAMMTEDSQAEEDEDVGAVWIQNCNHFRRYNCLLQENHDQQPSSWTTVEKGEMVWKKEVVSSLSSSFKSDERSDGSAHSCDDNEEEKTGHRETALTCNSEAREKPPITLFASASSIFDCSALLGGGDCETDDFPLFFDSISQVTANNGSLSSKLTLARPISAQILPPQRSVMNSEQPQRSVMNNEQSQRSVMNSEQPQRSVMNSEQPQRSVMHGVESSQSSTPVHERTFPHSVPRQNDIGSGLEGSDGSLCSKDEQEFPVAKTTGLLSGSPQPTFTQSFLQALTPFGPLGSQPSCECLAGAKTPVLSLLSDAECRMKSLDSDSLLQNTADSDSLTLFPHSCPLLLSSSSVEMIPLALTPATPLSLQPTHKDLSSNVSSTNSSDCPTSFQQDVTFPTNQLVARGCDCRNTALENSLLPLDHDIILCCMEESKVSNLDHAQEKGSDRQTLASLGGEAQHFSSLKEHGIEAANSYSNELEHDGEDTSKGSCTKPLSQDVSKSWLSDDFAEPLERTLFFENDNTLFTQHWTPDLEEQVKLLPAEKHSSYSKVIPKQVC